MLRLNPDPRTAATTDDKDALRALLAKGLDASLLREMIAFAAERLMELEVGAATSAAYGDWKTRAGSVELRIPKLRRGSYFPSFLEPPPQAIPRRG